MKEDHMRNGQLKPGYNVQVGSCNDFIMNWSIHQNRNDNGTMIPHLEKFKRLTGKLPSRIAADSGYGNQENYEYLKKNGIKSYVKYPLFHKEQKKSFQSKKYNWQNMKYDRNKNEFICPNGKKLIYKYTKIEKTGTGYPQKVRVHECEECSNCSNKGECTKAKGNRRIEFNKKLWLLKKDTKKNLLSKKGVEMGKKRAEYSERVFGQIKWNMGFKRFLLRGLEKVNVEWGLLCLAFNIKKMNKKDIEKMKKITKKMIKSEINSVYFIKSFNIKNLIFKKQKFILKGALITGHPLFYSLLNSNYSSCCSVPIL